MEFLDFGRGMIWNPTGAKGKNIYTMSLVCPHVEQNEEKGCET